MIVIEIGTIEHFVCSYVRNLKSSGGQYLLDRVKGVKV